MNNKLNVIHNIYTNAYSIRDMLIKYLSNLEKLLVTFKIEYQNNLVFVAEISL